MPSSHMRHRDMPYAGLRSEGSAHRNLGARKLTKSEAIELMLEDPNLMRRPLVLSKGKAIFGYDAKEYEKLR